MLEFTSVSAHIGRTKLGPIGDRDRILDALKANPEPGRTKLGPIGDRDDGARAV